MTLPTITPAKPRVRRKREAVAAPAAPTPPVGPLAVVSVQNVSFDGTSGACDVVMNTTAEFPLSDASGADPGKWSAQFEDIRYVGATVETVAFNVLRVTFGSPTPDGGDDVIAYSNAPSDISDAAGRQLAAFEDFPIQLPLGAA